MYINPAWRILTIGDGDLSFSASLWQHYQPKALTATIFDSEAALFAKYGDEFYQQLLSDGGEVLVNFDVTASRTWGTLQRHQYDVVIFQFPLVPRFSSADEFKQRIDNISINTLNRRLLRTYLVHCFDYFLAKTGAQLAFITSKEVAPYRQWNIEQALTINTAIKFIGKLAFNLDNFPGYRIRNVDRDKHVRATKSITYVYSSKANTELDDNVWFLPYHHEPRENYCHLCQSGVFYTDKDRQIHLNTKKHRQMLQFEQQWLEHLQR